MDNFIKTIKINYNSETSSINIMNIFLNKKHRKTLELSHQEKPI